VTIIYLVLLIPFLYLYQSQDFELNFFQKLLNSFCSFSLFLGIFTFIFFFLYAYIGYQFGIKASVVSKDIYSLFSSSDPVESFDELNSGEQFVKYE
jgi:hypothetical protein